MPRILCLMFAAFISLFALDVFDEGLGVWKTALALLMHLIPTFLILIVLAVSWRWEWVGAVLFTALALLYLFTSWGRLHWSAYVVISGPLCLVAALFLLNWLWRAELRASS
jgi:hypothetical protein